MRSILTAAAIVLGLGASTVALQPATPRQLNIIAFGAHPDDAELKAGGVAALWAANGHKVKFVAMTNGDIGHFSQAGGPLAQRRKEEVAECARILGIETEVLDIHDGELMPSLENRRTVARLIRNWQADIVIGHRPYDYHPDHRYTGVLLNDAAVVVAAPFFVPDTPPTAGQPDLHALTRTSSTIPSRSSRTSSWTSMRSADKKWACVVGDAVAVRRPAIRGPDATASNVPGGDAERAGAHPEDQCRWSSGVANQYRATLIELYGQERGSKVKYAEAFALNQYGRQVPVTELKKMFPTF